MTPPDPPPRAASPNLHRAATIPPSRSMRSAAPRLRTPRAASWRAAAVPPVRSHAANSPLLLPQRNHRVMTPRQPSIRSFPSSASASPPPAASAKLPSAKPATSCARAGAGIPAAQPLPISPGTSPTCLPRDIAATSSASSPTPPAHKKQSSSAKFSARPSPIATPPHPTNASPKFPPTPNASARVISLRNLKSYRRSYNKI